MKLSRFTILLSSLTTLSAYPILAGGQEDKILTSCFKKSPAAKRVRKHVAFEPAVKRPQKKQSSQKKLGMPQKKWDILSGWDKENQTQKRNIAFGSDPRTGKKFVIQTITEEVKTRLAQRKQQYLDNLTIADFEWEFAFSALERVLGLSDTIDERHTSWRKYSHDETMMVLRTVAFAFETVADIETSEYLAQHQAMINEIFDSLQESEYYEYRAGYDTGDMLTGLLHPVKRSVVDDLIADRKNILISMDIHSLQARSARAKRIISKLIQDNIFGGFDKRQAILDELEDCFRDNHNPKPLYENLDARTKNQLERFVIAMKEASFRFLTPSETDFADTFDQTHYPESSEDESEDLSEDFMVQERDDIDSQEIDPERIIERSISRLGH